MEYLEVENGSNARIKVVGIGGGGGNAVENMICSAMSGVTFITANTDIQALQKSQAEYRIQLGEKLTKGLGAGANPDVGRDAALESIDAIRQAIGDCDMVFVTAGMGGGTGTGAAPVIAQVAKEVGALTVAVVTKPFYFEGKKRLLQAEKGVQALRDTVDSIITIPNDRLLSLASKKATFLEMLKKADEILYYAVKGISDLIMVPGLINLDFADVKAVMSEMGLAMMGFGTARGESRAREAALKAITSPLLEDVTIDGARGVLMNITCGPDLTIEEVDEAASTITEAVHEDAKVFFGTVFDPDATDEMRITVIATGIESAMARDGAQQPKRDEAKPVDVITTLARTKPTTPPSGGGGGGGPQSPRSVRVLNSNQGNDYNIPAYLRKGGKKGGPEAALNQAPHQDPAGGRGRVPLRRGGIRNSLVHPHAGRLGPWAGPLPPTPPARGTGASPCPPLPVAGTSLDRAAAGQGLFRSGQDRSSARMGRPAARGPGRAPRPGGGRSRPWAGRPCGACFDRDDTLAVERGVLPARQPDRGRGFRPAAGRVPGHRLLPGLRGRISDGAGRPGRGRHAPAGRRPSRIPHRPWRRTADVPQPRPHPAGPGPDLRRRGRGRTGGGVPGRTAPGGPCRGGQGRLPCRRGRPARRAPSGPQRHAGPPGCWPSIRTPRPGWPIRPSPRSCPAWLPFATCF